MHDIILTVYYTVNIMNVVLTYFVCLCGLLGQWYRYSGRGALIIVGFEDGIVAFFMFYHFLVYFSFACHSDSVTLGMRLFDDVVRELLSLVYLWF